MADTFTPPPLSSHQGAADGFTPPPLSSHQDAPAPQTDDDIIRSYGYDPAVIKKAHLYSPGDFTSYVDHSQDPGWVKTIADSPVGGLGYGLLNAGIGGAQLAAHVLNKIGIASDADAQYVDLMHKVAHDDYYQNTRGGKPTSGIPEMLGAMALPLPGGAAKTVLGAVGKGIQIGRASCRERVCLYV